MQINAHSSAFSYSHYNNSNQQKSAVSGSVNTEGENTEESVQDNENSKSEIEKSSEKLQGELTAEEEQVVNKLQARDTEVRAHEAAHIAAGGGVVTGGASFSYQKGPDGKQYAIGGEVPIDASEGSSPEETIQKARQVRAAAMAPADPSPTDYKVAASAIMMEMRAQQELQQIEQKGKEAIAAYKDNLPPSENDSSNERTSNQEVA